MALKIKTKKEVEKMLAPGYVPTKADIEYKVEVVKLLHANKIERMFLPRQMSDSDIHSLSGMGELLKIIRPKSKNASKLSAFFSRPDYRKRLHGVKLAYRLHGRI